MTDAITAGIILVENGSSLPNSLLLQTKAFSAGWAAVTGSRAVFEKAIQEAGWTFFFMAGEIKTTVFGFNREKAIHTALSRMVSDVRSQKCNCIEITNVSDSSFWKVPYVSVSAHSRHLQKGMYFSHPQ